MREGPTSIGDDVTELRDASAAGGAAHRSELSPLSFLARSEFVYPDKVAVVHEDRRYTYREFGERVRRILLPGDVNELQHAFSDTFSNIMEFGSNMLGAIGDAIILCDKLCCCVVF